MCSLKWGNWYIPMPTPGLKQSYKTIPWIFLETEIKPGMMGWYFTWWTSQDLAEIPILSPYRFSALILKSGQHLNQHRYSLWFMKSRWILPGRMVLLSSRWTGSGNMTGSSWKSKGVVFLNFVRTYCNNWKYSIIPTHMKKMKTFLPWAINYIIK